MLGLPSVSLGSCYILYAAMELAYANDEQE